MLDIYFLSGRISSLEKKFIDYERLKKIIESKTFEEFINLLDGTFYKFPVVSNLEEILKFFENERLKIVKEIRETFEDEILDFFLLKYDYYNLAVIVEGKESYSFYGTVNFYKLKEGYEKNDLSVIPEILIDAFRIIKSKEAIDEKLLLLKIDYYRKIYKIAESISEFLKNYVKIEIDFANIETYLNKVLYEKRIEGKDIIENGEIKKEKFFDDEKFWQKLKTKYKKIKLPLNEKNFEIEKYIALMDYLKEGRIKPYGIDKIISFYIAREIEIENLKKITISKFYRQDEDFIKSIMMPIYQYKKT